MNQDWSFYLNPVLTTPKLAELKNFIQNERKTKNIYPASENVFKAYEYCSYQDTKVVIFGQDPYHTPDTAHGLCFSSLQQKRPPSLNIIFNEIYRDLNIQYDYNISQDEMFPSNNLSNWACNGFLLLNAVLTVEQGCPNSHKGKGWEEVIRATIEALNKKNKPVIFLLWGKDAKSFEPVIGKQHIVLKAAHPAAEIYAGGKAGFYGCKHFSTLRDILPEIHGYDERIVLDLTPFFKKTKAIRYLKETYPQYADKASEFIMQYLTIPIWLNPHHRLQYYNEFKEILSTK